MGAQQAVSQAVQLVVLGLNAYLLYWWFKRDRRLDALGWAVRLSAIVLGILIFLGALQVTTYQNQEQVLRYLVFPSAGIVVVFLFFSDASYFLAQGVRRLVRIPNRDEHSQLRLTPMDRLSVMIRGAAILGGLSLCLSSLVFGNLQNQVALNRFLVLPSAGLALLFASYPTMSVFLSQTLRHVFRRS